MEFFVKVLFVLLGAGGIGAPALLLIYVLFFPEKIQILSSLLWQLLSHIRTFASFAKKKYIQNDLEGRLNDYVRGVQKQAPYLENTRVSVEWANDENVDREAFLKNNKVLVRLRKNDPDDLNFVHGAYLAVSKGWLYRVKKYISKPQKEAVDLYVMSKIIEKEKRAVRDIFLDEYLHPRTTEPHSRVSELFDDFCAIDEGGYFYPVFLQELDFLGEKVYGRRKDNLIVTEVYTLIGHLKAIAQRKIGEEGNLRHVGRYTRSAVMIVGKRHNLTPNGDVWIRYIRRHLIPANVETLYVHGREDHREVIDSVCEGVSDKFERCASRSYKTVLRYDDRVEPSKQYLVVLRKKSIGMIQPSI